VHYPRKRHRFTPVPFLFGVCERSILSVTGAARHGNSLHTADPQIPGNVKPDDPDSPEGAGHWNASRQHRLIPRVPTGGKGLDKGGGMFRDRAFPCPAEFSEKDSTLH
jgi:hypothetical protein